MGVSIIMYVSFFDFFFFIILLLIHNLVGIGGSKCNFIQFLKNHHAPFVIVVVIFQNTNKKRIYFLTTKIDSGNPQWEIKGMEIKMESWLLLFLFVTLGYVN